MKTIKGFAPCRHLGRKRLRRIAVQSFCNQVGHPSGVFWRHAPAHQFRRADPQTVHVTVDRFDRQPDTTGQKPGTPQCF